MGRMMIWICAYRDWAKKIYYEASKQLDVRLLTSREELKNSIDLFKKGDKIFFLGWSWIVPNVLTENFECICLHPSPLPKYRGGSPIQHQIINNESESAVTFFVMNEKIDAGMILFQRFFSLEGQLNEIFDRITYLGTLGLLEIVSGKTTNLVQNESQATFFKRRKPKQSEIKHDDFCKKPAREIYNKVRALQDPYPNAFITCSDGKKLFLKVVDYEK